MERQAGGVISDDDIQKALDYLMNSPGQAAKARAERIYIEEFSKTLKAQIMKEHVSLAVNGQEREALADPRYKSHLQALKEAVYQDEYHRFMLKSAEATIEAWRTQCSNKRAERV